MAVNDDLRNKNTKNDVFTLQFRNKIVKNINKILSTNEFKLRSKMLSSNINKLTKKNSKRVLNWTNKANKIITKQVNAELEKQLKELIPVEVQFQSDSIKSSAPDDIPVKLKEPKTDSIFSKMKTIPYETKKYNQWLSGWSRNEKQILNNTIQKGVTQGNTIQQVTKELFGTKSNNYKDGKLQKNRNEIQTIVRTTTNHVVNTAKDTFYRENDDVIKGYQWISTLDSRTTLICINLDGKQDLYDGSKTELNGQVPPVHYNQILKGTLITTKKGLMPIEDIKPGDYVLTHNKRFRKVIQTMKKYNMDRVLKLVCSNNVSISLTDDHPILTRNKGWVYPRDVHIGDIIFQNFYKFTQLPFSTFSFIKQRILLDSHNCVTQVTKKFIPNSVFFSSTGMTSSVNFKNNTITKKKVNNIFINRFLKLKTNIKMGFKKIKNTFLMKSRIFSHMVTITNSCFQQCFFIIGRVVLFHSFRAFFKKMFVFFRVLFSKMVNSFRPAMISFTSSYRFALTSYFNRKPFTSTIQSSFSKTVFPFNKPNRFSIFPMFFLDKIQKFFFSFVHRKTPPNKFNIATIITIVEKNVNDFMYDLSVEDDETYIANGLLIHNCRSTTTPVLKSWKEMGIDSDELEPSTRASMNGQVAETLTYPKWLEQQTAGFQKNVLGPTRYKAWKDGDIKISQFTDNKNNILTIDQLKAKGLDINGKKE